jgi:protein SCO1/2
MHVAPPVDPEPRPEPLETAAPSPFPRWLSRGIAALALTLVAAVTIRALRASPPLPVLGRVPAFHLVDERGTPIGPEALAGHPTVVDFIFTRCTSSCPRLTATMGALQARLARAHSRAKLLSFSVDPENDTPAVLARYAAGAQADPARWSFVTGPADDVERAVVFGFKVSAAKVARGADEYDVTHGDWFVLVDRVGAIRGYYATDEVGALERLVGDIGRLEREQG